MVPVEPEQGIAVEEDGRNPGNHDGVIGQRADDTGLDTHPHKDGDRRDHQFDDHACRADDRPLPLTGEGR